MCINYTSSSNIYKRQDMPFDNIVISLETVIYLICIPKCYFEQYDIWWVSFYNMYSVPKDMAYLTIGIEKGTIQHFIRLIEGYFGYVLYVWQCTVCVLSFNTNVETTQYFLFQFFHMKHGSVFVLQNRTNWKYQYSLRSIFS